MQYGLLCYPEASHGYNKNGNKRIDLLVNGDIEGQEVTFLVEAKKMYSSEQASKMFCDFQKMKIFAPVSDSIKKPEYAVLLAVTVSSSNAEWWSNPYECSSNGWNQLMGALNQCEVHGTIMLDTQYRQHIVYAIAKL
ncbi:hypothetical protein GZ77_05350 [Endozoicomonas montiporae]|uniref:Uncharacterized protein n=2 Tax=Endozoicomonas montiporae TaxID=1027273 RepID=A0A081NBV1_9GAMM|nr:hypothetical protein GZ77_05350 [Endozoicomonas montiporae]